MIQEPIDDNKVKEEDTTNWKNWYIFLAAVLVGQIVLFWIITNHYAG